MTKSNLPSSKVLAVYWLPSVGIGPATSPPPVLPGKQTVHVPLTDVLNYTRPDGTPQISVVNLTGANFTKSTTFQPPYLDINPELQKVLSDGSVQQLQQAGIKVVLTIMGGGGTFGWSSIPANQVQTFVDYLNATFLDQKSGYGLDGIDVDDEYAQSGDTLVDTIKAMRMTFDADKIVSKALWNDLNVIPQIKNYLTYGGIMNYGDSASYLESVYTSYINQGMANHQLMIGVNAGPVAQAQGNFTSVKTTEELATWQPSGGEKLGMMIWTFSQDIQQFTAYPQNQVSLQFPNAADHQWQQSIINTWYPKKAVKTEKVAEETQ